MLQSFSIKEGNSFGKYLGFSIIQSRHKPSYFQFLQDDFKNRLASWKIKFLNMVGRATLITSTLNTLPNHVMQYIHIPTTVINKMEHYQRNFLWGATIIRKKLHLIKWKKITTTKEKGGLNIQNLRTKINTLLASLARRIFQNTHSLWAPTLLNKYLPLTKATNHSLTWRNILKGWNHCQLGLQWRIGTGHHIRLWTDTWIKSGTTLRSLLIGPLPQSHQTYKLSHVLKPQGWNWANLPFEIPWDIKKYCTKLYRSVYTQNKTTSIGHSQITEGLLSILCIKL